MAEQITPERIAELRAIIAAATTWHNATFLIAARKDFPSALNTIEAQAKRIEELEAALSIKINDARAFADAAVQTAIERLAPSAAAPDLLAALEEISDIARIEFPDVHGQWRRAMLGAALIAKSAINKATGR